jgi:hypothetical protein
MYEPSPDNLTPAERELEAALAALRPAAVKLDAAAAMFEAGRRAGGRTARRQVAAWRAAAAVLLVTAGASFALNAGPRVVEHERLVYAPAPQQPVTTPAPGGGIVPFPVAPDIAASPPHPPAAAPQREGMLALRQAVMDGGIDALPRSPRAALWAVHVGDVVIP